MWHAWTCIVQNYRYYLPRDVWSKLIWINLKSKVETIQLMSLGSGLAIVENPEYIILQVDSLELSEQIQNHLWFYYFSNASRKAHLWFLKCKFLSKTAFNPNSVYLTTVRSSWWHIFGFIFRYSNLRQYWFANKIKYFGGGLWKRFTQFQIPKVLQDTLKQFSMPLLCLIWN